MTVQHIQQKHANGCVVACLSMVTGIPYDDIINDFTGDRMKEGLSPFTYDTWLGYKGYAIVSRYKHYSPLHAERDQWPCEPFADIHIASIRTNIGSHAVIWLRDGTVLDPLKNSPCQLSDYNYEDVQQIIGLYKVIEPSSPGPLTLLHWSDATSKCMWCGADVDSYKYRDPCPARNK